MKTLKDASIGSTVKVVKLHGEGAVKRRIMDMGITKNVDVYIRKVAPLGDPMEVTVRGYELSLRKADAEMIEILRYVARTVSHNISDETVLSEK
jgi:ferrous iron transport protein A